MINHKKNYEDAQPTLEKADIIRCKYHKAVEPYRYAFWFIAVLGGAYLFYLINFPSYPIFHFATPYLLFSTITFLIFSSFKKKKTSEYKQIFKSEIAPKIVKSLGSSFLLSVKTDPPSKEIEQSHFFDEHSFFTYGDTIQGKIHKQNFRLTELQPTAKEAYHLNLNNQRYHFFIKIELTISLPTQVWLLPKRTNANTFSERGYTTLASDNPYHVLVKSPDEKKLIHPKLWDAVTSLNTTLQANKLIQKGKVIPIHFSPSAIFTLLPYQKKLLRPQLNRTFDSLSFVRTQAFFLDPISDFLIDLTLT